MLCVIAAGNVAVLSICALCVFGEISVDVQ